MADKIALDLIVKSEGAKTISELKQSIKDLKNEALKFSEGSEEFIKFTDAAAAASNKLQNVNEAIQNLNPERVGAQFARVGSTIASGFQAAQGALALFGASSQDVQEQLLKIQAATALAQGVQNVQDLGKSFQSLFAVIKANPFAMFLTIATAVVGVLVLLKDKIKIVGDVVDGLSQSFKDLTDFIGLTSFALDEMANKQLDASRESLEIFTKHQNDKIEILRAGGKSAEEEEVKLYETQRKKAIEQMAVLAQLARDRNSALNEEEQKKYDEAFEIGAKAELELKKIKAKSDAEFAADYDKEQQLAKERREKQIKDIQEFNKRISDERIKKSEIENQIIIDLENYAKESEANKTNSFEEGLMKRFEINNQILSQSDAVTKDVLEREQKTYEDTAAAKLSIQQSSFDALNSLGNIFIGNSKKLEKFQKGIALAQIAADTARALSGALANANSPTPDNLATGGLAGIAKYAALAATILSNVARAKQILGESGGGDLSLNQSGANISSARGVSVNSSSPTVTLLNPNKIDAGFGQLNPIKVYVTESDISSTQDNVNKIIEKATIS